MYEGLATHEIIARILIAVLFVGTGVLNATGKFKQHLDRMIAAGVPMAKAALIIGFIIQIVAGTMVLLNYRTDIAAIVLIVFLVLATAIFHRWWQVTDDPLRRHLHLSFVFSNIGLAGALLLLI